MLSSEPLTLRSASSARTEAAGAVIARHARAGDLITLGGQMGAGKTTLVAGLARALDITMPVTSPTFTLVHELRPDGDSGAEVAHVDLYRLETYADVESLGLDEILDGTKIVVVEWGEVVGPMLGTDRLEIRLDYVDPDAVDARELTIRCHGDAWIRRRDELWTDLKDVLEVTD